MEMQVTREQGIARRKKVRLTVLCRSGGEQGAGRMVNVSLSGALLEPASIRPDHGATVKLVFTSSGEGKSSELRGTVARHTETGFAIEFLVATDALRELVGEAA